MSNFFKINYICLLFILFLSASPASANTMQAAEMDTMIGQMIMVGFRGMEIDNDSPITQDIEFAHIGGVILFNNDCLLDFGPRNIESPEQLKRLTDSLQKYSEIPLLVAVDQEGGRVQRLKAEQGFDETPSAAELGADGKPETAYKAGFEVGKNLRSSGFNLDFAPDLDVNVNPDNPVIGKLERSFSDDPDVVSKLGEAFIRGLRSQGIFSCVKHFPGHGSSTGDSHLGLTDVSSTWTEKELLPFEYIVKNNRTDMVMTAHIFNRNLDSEYPATLSSKVISDILRKKFGYNGVVITDDMQMKAISDSYGFEESIYRAVEAGADILLFGNNIAYEKGIGRRVFNVLKSMVEQGRISPERIKQSYDRIMKLKSRIAQ